MGSSPSCRGRKASARTILLGPGITLGLVKDDPVKLGTLRLDD